jgi:phospholipase/lecithinase/hemolysin
MTKSMFSSAIALALIAGSASLASAQANNRGYTDMIVFGDSLSDTGNSQALTSAVPILNARPVHPYYDNGRWTNGPSQNGFRLENRPNPLAPIAAQATLGNTAYGGVWHETLARRMGIPVAAPVGAGVGPFGGVSRNFAVGGATTDTGTVDTAFGNTTYQVVRNMGYQVGTQYLAGNPTISSSTLYVMYGGGNDIRNAALDETVNTPATQNRVRAVALAAARQQKNYIQQIVNKAGGANAAVNVMWPNVVPLHLIPDFANTADPVTNVRRQLSQIAVQAFFAEWSLNLTQLRTANPGLNLMGIDLYNFFLQVRDTTNFPNHPLGGLDQVTPVTTTNLPLTGFSDPIFRPQLNASLGGLITTPVVNPDAYMFWDPVHPTAIVHDTMGLFAFDRLTNAVPAPSAIALMGLGGLVASRRRRPAAA